MVTKPSIALALASVLVFAHRALAFSPSPSDVTPCRYKNKTTRPPAAALASSFFADATAPKVRAEVKKQIDCNGREFSPGTRVAITLDRSVRAFGVPKAAYGSFDPDGKFVPQDESNVTRGTSCLILPGGLRGEVKKVYDTNEWDRAHPILVKFGAGADREEEGGFDVPKGFQMHFDADEIEVLDS